MPTGEMYFLRARAQLFKKMRLSWKIPGYIAPVL